MKRKSVRFSATNRGSSCIAAISASVISGGGPSPSGVVVIEPSSLKGFDVSALYLARVDTGPCLQGTYEPAEAEESIAVTRVAGPGASCGESADERSANGRPTVTADLVRANDESREPVSSVLVKATDH
ncbi:hypothetical protein GCM10010403_08170 [Glycomyces rutgersensis]|uniref:Uncharacterized protein n=1 Tax=Glycomyces rutgersensis TaxID=58115 RepID=A0ABP5S5F4_9ACTN